MSKTVGEQYEQYIDLYGKSFWDDCVCEGQNQDNPILCTCEAGLRLLEIVLGIHTTDQDQGPAADQGQTPTANSQKKDGSGLV